MTATKALGYRRVSTDEQRESGAGLDAQAGAVTAEAKLRGWDLELVTDAGVSGGTLPDERPALGPALARLDRAEASVLVVPRLDRLGRSLAAVAALLDRAERHRWSVVVCDASGLDMATPTGRLVAGVLASAAAFERDLIRQRTREALAARKAAGVRLGRPTRLSDGVVRQVLAYRECGLSMRAIAARLTEEGVETASGSNCWAVSAVQGVLASENAKRLAGSALAAASAAVSREPCDAAT